MNKNEYVFKINSTSIKLSIGDKVFKPTATTSFLLKDALKLVNKSKDILDLGCGSGVIGVFVNRLNKNKNKIFASDISGDAVDYARKNFEKYNCNYDLKKGSLFLPWKNKKFDLIINDVSGISEKLAKNSSWFKNVPCKTGTDGTALTLKIISSSNKYLNKGGGIIFPIISLSNMKKIENLLKKKFKKIKVMSNNYWFLPDELNKNTNELIEMKKKNLINFEIKYGKIICNTQIVYATN